MINKMIDRKNRYFNEINWSKFGLEDASIADKTRFRRWVEEATSTSPYLIDFVESALITYQKGVFIGIWFS